MMRKGLFHLFQIIFEVEVDLVDAEPRRELKESCNTALQIRCSDKAHPVSRNLGEFIPEPKEVVDGQGKIPFLGEDVGDKPPEMGGLKDDMTEFMADDKPKFHLGKILHQPGIEDHQMAVIFGLAQIGSGIEVGITGDVEIHGVFKFESLEHFPAHLVIGGSQALSEPKALAFVDGLPVVLFFLIVTLFKNRLQEISVEQLLEPF